MPSGGDTGSSGDSTSGDTGGGGGDGGGDDTGGGGDDTGGGGDGATDSGAGDTGPGDTGPTCDPEAGLTISCGVGECTNVVEACSEAGVPATCTPKAAGVEICNGKDDDCDGLTDEDLGETTCGTGECQKTQKNCVDGAPKTCTPGTPGTEICNGKDDDCDGLTDEDLGDTTCGVGECKVTVNNCEGGLPKTCTPKAGSTEICDGKDNDCDGTVDNGNPGGGSPCSTGKPGVCAAGTTKCSGGAIICEQNVAAGPETCDGKDNDCDGAIDNGNPGGGVSCDTGKVGVCATGTTACTGGVLLCNQTYAPSAELCDGLDNNCNGSIDEGNPGGGLSCNTGKNGICNAGTTVCLSGSITCSQNTLPKTEVCNGLDDNCDGSTDEGNPGGGGTCATGKPGICNTGTLGCVSGALVCQQTEFGKSETCNGLDDNCNGVIDDGALPGVGDTCTVSGLVGECAAGAKACETGTLKCKQTVFSVAESCDGKDNNCNGIIDDKDTADYSVSSTYPTSCVDASTKSFTIAPTGSLDIPGYIDSRGDDWFQVQFTAIPASGVYWHPLLNFSANPSSQFAFEVFTACGVPVNPVGAAAACASAGTPNKLTTFEMNYADSPGGCAGFAECVDATPKVGTFIVHVTRVVSVGGNTCGQYVLRAQNI